MTKTVVLGTPVHTPSAEYQYPKTVIGEPVHPSTIALIECWRGHEAEGGMRMGRDIPCRTMASLLNSIVIAEPIGDWDDAHIRLAGSVLTERFGRDVTGMKINELYKDDPEGGRILLRGAKRANETREPMLIDARVLAGKIEVMRIEVVFLPIFAPDGVTQWCLTGTFRF